MTMFVTYRINALLIVLFCLVGLFTSAQNYYLYIGTYTRASSEGIYMYQFNSNTGDLTPVSIAKVFTNPSFLSISADHRFLYALGGMKGDSVRSFAIEQPSHHLRFLNAQSIAPGSGAAHLQVDETGKWLITGNYGSGGITVLPVLPDGSIGTAVQNIQLQGKSIDPERQDKPHVHSINISPDNKYVFVPDLGTDKIMTYTLNQQTGQLIAADHPYTTVTAGSGPRHFTFHPNGKFAYVIQEMYSTITAFNYKKGSLTAFQTVQTLPADYTGRKWSADIHISPDGKFLYGSNRAHESLVIFRINPKNGSLTFVGHESVRGKTPRNFVIDPTGNFILVANQDSNNITVFKRDKQTGKLMYTGKEISVSQAVCLKFIE